jgi:phospholipase C
VRVPALLVSPWVRKGRVDHQVYDHTSLLATVKSLFGLPSFLTRRDARANTLADGNFGDTPRPLADTPSNLAALVPAHASGAARPGKLSDLQQSLLTLRAAMSAPGGAGGARPGPAGRPGEPQSP